jgi:hypothetical protein
VTNILAPRTGPNSRVVAFIDDSADGDGAPSLMVIIPRTLSGDPIDTVLKVNAISAGGLRFSIAGGHGTWRYAPGTYNETIAAGAGSNIAIEFAAFTVAEIELSASSVDV